MGRIIDIIKLQILISFYIDSPPQIKLIYSTNFMKNISI